MDVLQKLKKKYGKDKKIQEEGVFLLPIFVLLLKLLLEKSDSFTLHETWNQQLSVSL